MSQTKAQLIQPIGIVTAGGVVVTGVVTASSFDGEVVGTATSIISGGNLNLGDVILFSTTLLHKTSTGKHPRLGLSMTVKNYKYKETSFSDNHNWKIFSYSEMTKIQRILGNHYLSPFRVIDNQTDIEISY